MPEIPFYRFELGFEGEPMGCGFLQGMDDLGFDEETQDFVNTLFKDLPCPSISEPCEFWFTKKGLRHFAGALSQINQLVNRYGWYLLETQEYRDTKQAIYLDEWQACWSPDLNQSRSWIEVPDKTKFSEK